MIALVIAAALAAAGGTYSGRSNQLKVPIPRAAATINIDGMLDEDVWAGAARLVDFSQYAPVDGRPAEDATEVLVWYSETAIYFGIKAHAAPGTVHATLADRDKIDGDDFIQIFLDTFNDGRRASMFAVNPFGVQADGTLVEGTGSRGGALFAALESGRELPDLTSDFVFTSKGRLTSEGYEVEIEIPFKTLRFPRAPVQDWSINIVRRTQSSGHDDSWTPARRANASFLGQAGQLVELRDLHSGLVMDVTPVVTSKVDGRPDGARWTYDAGRPEYGGNVRWGVTPNLTINGTINPDFSQVEADASQVQFDPRSAIFFAEKRPFFLDNAELFSTPNNLIYTRRIVSPLEATKLTGKIGSTSLAVLSAVDDVDASASGTDHPVFTIARLQRDAGERSKVGLVFTDRHDGDRTNRVLAADARLVFGSIHSLQLQTGGSWTRTSEGAKAAPLWQAVFSRDGRHFGLRYLATGIHDDFRADSGFINRGGIIHSNLTHRATWFGSERSLLQSWSSAVVVDGIWQYKTVVVGEPLLEKKLHFNNTAKLKKGWVLGGSVLIESFAFDPQLYGNYAIRRGNELLPFTGTPQLPNLDYVLTADTPQFARFSASVLYLWGRDENFYEWAPADIVYATYAINWRPTDKLRVSPQFVEQRFRRPDGSDVGVRRIPRLKIEYQIARPVFLRVVGEYNSNRQDTLRDDTRTNLPIVIRDPATGSYVDARAFEHNTFRMDWLFSYQPTPGTVFFIGYGSSYTEPQALRFNDLRRTTDGLFAKFSYLFRL